MEIDNRTDRLRNPAEVTPIDEVPPSIEAIAIEIMQMCNESLECPLCASADGEHEIDALCSRLQKALE